MPLLPVHEINISRICRNRSYGEALNYLRTVHDDYIGRPAADVASFYTSLGRVQSYRGDYDQADIYFDRAEKTFFGCTETKLARAESHIQRGKLNEAATILGDLIENHAVDFPIGSKDWINLYTYSMRCMKLRGDYKAGLLCFEQLRPYLDPRDVAIRDHEFMSRMVDSPHPDAKIAGTGSYSKHLREREAYGVYLQGNALACIFLRNRLSETEDPKQRVVMHSFLARIYMEKGQLDQAYREIQSARAITEHNPFINGYLIGWQLKRGFNQQARNTYDEYGLRLQRLPQIAIFLARSFQLAGEYDLSIELAKAVLRQKDVREETRHSAQIILSTSRTHFSGPTPA